MKQDQMDHAIDAVVARMIRVEEDGALAGRILAALPDRSPWILQSWIPRLAGVAALASIALVVLRTFDAGSTDVLQTAAISAPTVELATTAPEHRTTVEPAQIVRRTIVEPPLYDPGTTVDFERSLPSIAAVGALNIDSLVPVSLPEDAPLTLPPLAIADLPLTADSISPR